MRIKRIEDDSNKNNIFCYMLYVWLKNVKIEKNCKKFKTQIMSFKSKNLLTRSKKSKVSESKIQLMKLWPTKKQLIFSSTNVAEEIVEICDLIYKDGESIEKAKEENTYNPINFGLSYAEIVGDDVPIMIEINLRFDNRPDNDEDSDSEENDFYKMKFIFHMIHIIQEVMIENFDLSEDEEELECFLVENDPVWNNKFFIKTIRFHFPFTKVPLEFLNDIFRKEVIKRVTSKNLLKHFNVAPCDTLENIFGVIKEYVILHGCKEDFGSSPMVFKTIFSHITKDDLKKSDEYIINNKRKNINSNIYNANNHQYIGNGLLPISEEFIDSTSNIFWLPLFLSLNYFHMYTQFKEQSDSENDQKEEEEIDDKLNSSEMEKMITFLEMISPRRWKKLNYWLDIGICICNITDESKQGLNIWKKYSQKYMIDLEIIDADFEKNYKKTKPYDMKTIEWYAHLDSPYDYQLWSDNDVEPYIIAACKDITHLNIMEIFFRLVKLRYVYVSEIDSFLKFLGHRYARDIGGLSLKREIPNTLIPFLNKWRTKYCNERTAEKTDEEKKAIEEKISAITKMISKLGSDPYQNSILKLLKTTLIDPNFSRSADVNLNLMGWVNGVSECGDDDIVFRDGKPQDYVTMSTRIKYPKSMTMYDPLVLELRKYFEKVFRDDETREYEYLDDASFLLGGNPDKLFRNWIGEKNASKSQKMKLMQETLGDYFTIIDACTISKVHTESGGKPDPALDMAFGCRFVAVVETDGEDLMDCGKIKKYTTDDGYFSRRLHDNGSLKILTFKLVHISNMVAKIPGADDAFYGRELIVCFTSSWVLNPPDSEAEQMRLGIFKMDQSFPNRLKELSQANAFLMFENFKNYRKIGLKVFPRLSLNAIKSHQEDNDPYVSFIMERLDFVLDNNNVRDTSITLSNITLYPKFKFWFKNCFPNDKVPDSVLFKKEMCMKNRLGPQTSRKEWVGVKIREFQDHKKTY